MYTYIHTYITHVHIKIQYQICEESVVFSARRACTLVLKALRLGVISIFLRRVFWKRTDKMRKDECTHSEVWERHESRKLFLERRFIS